MHNRRDSLGSDVSGVFSRARRTAASALTPLAQALPEFDRILKRDGSDNWSFFFSLALVFTATRDAPAEFRFAVLDYLPNEGVRGFANLHEFLDTRGDVPYNVGLGTWVLLNLAGRRPSGEEELKVANAVGTYISSRSFGVVQSAAA